MYISFETKARTIAAIKALQAAQQIGIKEEIKTLFHRRKVILNYIKVIHSELTYKLHPIEFDLFYDYVGNQISRYTHLKFVTQTKKLEYFKIKQKKLNTLTDPLPINLNFNDRFINYSNVVFTEQEQNIQKKGFKYSPYINQKTKLETLIVETENALRGVKNTQLPKHSNIITKDKCNSHNKDLKTLIKSIKNKIKENNLTLTKANKSNAIVMIPKIDYDEKMNTFAQEELRDI